MNMNTNCKHEKSMHLTLKGLSFSFISNLNNSISGFVAIGNLILPPQPTRPGLIAIRQSDSVGGCYA